MKKRLTQKSIDSLRACEKRYEVRDVVTPGLMIRVSVNGNKNWYLATRLNGRSKRIKIGTFPVLSLSDAREQARSILRDIQLGTYGREENVPTLGEVIPQFIQIYARPRNRDWRGSERILKKFERLNHRPIDEIKRAEVVRVLDDIAMTAPHRANRALAAIRKLFNWCVDRGALESNPVAGLKPPAKEVARDRVLTDDELKACWTCANSEGFPFGSFLHLLILTGQRRGEVSGMRWSELDLDKAVWTLPKERVKNGCEHTVPLSSVAVEILREVPRFLNSDYVFSTTGKSPISGFGRLKKRLDNHVGASNWRFHDLRRSVATGMASSGVQPHIIEAILNHKTGIVSGVAAIYNRFSYADEKREALERWSVYVQNEGALSQAI